MQGQADETLTVETRTGAGSVPGAGGTLGRALCPDPVALVRASENTDKTPCVLDFPGQAVQPGSGDPH